MLRHIARLHLMAVPFALLLSSAAAWAQEGSPTSAPAAGPDPTGAEAGSIAPAHGKVSGPRAFGGADLFLGRTMKQPVGDKMFTAGIDVGVAPLDIALSAARDAVVVGAVDKVCGQDASCHAGADRALKSLGNVSETQWASVRAAAGSDADLQAALQDVGVSEADAQQVVKIVDSQVTPAQRQTLIDLVRKTQRGTNILLDPFLDVNLKWIDLKLSIPFTIAHLDGVTRAYMANLGLDAKSGYAWEWGLVGVGLTGGLSVYFPTGMAGAAAAQAADLFSTPKFAYGYLTLAPYLAAGVDFTWVTLQASVEIDSMHAVRGDPAVTSIQFLRYGAGVVILPRLNPKWTVSVIGEINGLAPIHNADPYDALFALAGVQLRLYLLKLALAVQVPVVTHQQRLGQVAGIDFGGLAKYYVLTRLAFVF